MVFMKKISEMSEREARVALANDILYYFQRGLFVSRCSVYIHPTTLAEEQYSQMLACDLMDAPVGGPLCDVCAKGAAWVAHYLMEQRETNGLSDIRRLALNLDYRRNSVNAIVGRHEMQMMEMLLENDAVFYNTFPDRQERVVLLWDYVRRHGEFDAPGFLNETLGEGWQHG